ncbi:hypothetical protein [Dolosigranulum savutiense]|uniref:YitT family protein n=1 Tax=Dolosigranulum savutiense TaxID=3110288 RepID=A0AB74U4H0_9LACT
MNKKKSYLTRKLVILIAANILATAGIGMILRADIGVSPFDAFNKSLGDFLGVTVGTVMIAMNLSFFVLQRLVRGRDFPKIEWLQIPVTFLFGAMVDFFYYVVFRTMPDSYIGQWSLFLVGVVVLVFHIGVIMSMRLITTPLEGLCQALSDHVPLRFAHLRLIADVLLVGAMIVLIQLGAENNIREGTVVLLFAFSILMDYFMQLQRPILAKFHLLS